MVAESESEAEVVCGVTSFTETDLEFAHRWAASRGREPVQPRVGGRWIWSLAEGDDDAVESDLPSPVFLVLRHQCGTVFFREENDAWEALAYALAQLRKTVDVL